MQNRIIRQTYKTRFSFFWAVTSAFNSKLGKGPVEHKQQILSKNSLLILNPLKSCFTVTKMLFLQSQYWYFFVTFYYVESNSYLINGKKCKLFFCKVLALSAHCLKMSLCEDVMGKYLKKVWRGPLVVERPWENRFIGILYKAIVYYVQTNIH
jgi:hypothetical protein